MFSFFRWTKDRRENLQIEGTCFYLRPLRVEDADDMYLFASDPEVVRYLPWEANTTRTAVKAFLLEQIMRRKSGHSLGFSIIYRETGQMIGSTDLMDLKVVRGRAELGYLLASPFWNRGIMTEAARLTVQYGFDDLRLQCVYAWADQSNAGSRRVMEKTGMKAVEWEFRTVKYERRPYVRYEMERTDWMKTLEQ